MGGRGSTGKTKTFSVIGAARNAPLRSARTAELTSKKAAPGGRMIAGFRQAGITMANKSPILLSQKTIRQAVDLPDAIAGHIGTPERRANKIAEGFNSALVALKSSGGKPSQSVRFSVDMSHAYRGKQATYEFKGRLLRNPETKKLDRGIVNLVRIKKFE